MIGQKKIPGAAAGGGPERVAGVLLTLVILTMSFNDDLEYGKAYRKAPEIYQDVLHGTATAPSQYRVGVLRIADFLAHHTPLPLRHWLTLISLASTFIAVFSFFYLLRHSRPWLQATNGARWFGAVLFIFLVNYNLGWVTYFQRPETLPTACLVALVLMLASKPLPFAKPLSTVLAFAGIVLLGVAQGFVRADVALGLNAGIVLLCLTSAGRGLALPRPVQATASLLAALGGFAVQYYFVHFVYPQANYGSTAKIQLGLNLSSPGEWTAFTLFILSVAWTIYRVLRGSNDLVEAPARAAIYGAVVYGALWFTFGRIEEVRIFLPMALAVAPVTVMVAMQVFFPVEQNATVLATD